jgi:dipeptidyl aminopeptidase/acylaminoacyl peptidase
MLAPARIARLAAAAAAAALVLLPAAPARATLVYQKGLVKLSVWVAADDGSGARRLVTGTSPQISRDGQTVVYVSGGDGENPELRELPVAGGAPRVLLRPYRFGVFAWSADGRYIAAQSGPLNGKQRIVLIDRTTGLHRTIATGYFSGASFSPASDQLVYSRFDSDRTIFPRANLEVAPVAGGAPHALTTDGRSLFPVWGPNQIAYVRYAHPTGAHKRMDGPKYNLWLLNSDGSGRRRLTNDTVPFLLAGLVPTAWSADGTRLLAQFNGQDTTYPVTVNPVSGREHKIGSIDEGIVGTALSRDGSTILGWRLRLDSPKNQAVVTVPYGGGAPHVLFAKASEPDWNR